jgi:hypothetical protein
MRRFNMMSVCTVFLIILLISNFKEIIASVAGLLGRVTVYAVYAVLWILDFFISKLSTIREADAPAQDNLLLVFEGISPTGNFIFNVLRNFTVLYIIYRILFGLAGRIPAYVRNIAGLVAQNCCHWIRAPNQAKNPIISTSRKQLSLNGSGCISKLR